MAHLSDDRAADGGPAVPVWAATFAAAEAEAEVDDWTLEVIKDGASVNVVSLGSRPRWLVGRAADAVQIELQHASISRVHAALQLSRDGKLYVGDCSAHGTRLNKTDCPRGKYVELRDGDVLAFGASSRVFAVHSGRSALRDKAVRALETAGDLEALKREKAAGDKRRVRGADDDGASAALQRAATAAKAVRDVSWGFGADASDESEAKASEVELPDYLKNDKIHSEYGGEIKTTLADGEKNVRDAKLHERLEAKVKKLNNVRMEQQRILRKDTGDDSLTPGQLGAVDRNTQAIDKLVEDIARLEDEVRGRNTQRAATKKQQAGESSDSDDDYMAPGEDGGAMLRDHTVKLVRAKTAEDRALRRQQRFAAPVFVKVNEAKPKELDARVEMTYEALSSHKTRVDAEVERLDRVAQDAESARTLAEKSLAVLAQNDDQTDEDKLEVFMATNEAQRCDAAAEAAKRDSTSLKAESIRLGKLCKIAAPALEGLSASKTLGSLTKEAAEAPPDGEGATQRPSAPADAPCGEDRAAPRAPAVDDAARRPADAEAAPRAVQGPRAVGAARADEAVAPTLDGQRAPPKKRLPMGPTIPDAELFKMPEPVPELYGADELAAADAAEAASQLEPKRKRPRGDRGDRKKKPFAPTVALALDEGELEGGDRIWLPPTGQDGSGRTALNAKLGY
ncbi:hypothetical protein M885DRAFT_538278 [Pelagophyceae sp. CCMP2097]|nr:hypothetical protein M885DRAFT_538278 [Pelagophyceae sp. CCMP2097]